MKKLDPRIKDRKYIFDCFNADEAKKYIGKKCYMTDYFERFEDVESTAKCILHKIEDSGPFVEGNFRFSYCLPFEFVAPKENTPKEKKFRPYTLMEFEDKFHIGLPINFRKKGAEGHEKCLILNGYSHHQYEGETITYIYIGSNPYTLDELFKDYEFQTHYTEDFEPFGVEE